MGNAFSMHQDWLFLILEVSWAGWDGSGCLSDGSVNIDWNRENP